jgi:hypothetical protein
LLLPLDGRGGGLVATRLRLADSAVRRIQDEVEQDIYEEVDEREYESRQAGDRQEAHDFIEDDGTETERQHPPPSPWPFAVIQGP